VPEAASASLAPGLLACSGCGTSGHLNKLSDESADISLSVAAVAACGALGVDLAVARPVQDGPAIDPEHAGYLGGLQPPDALFAILHVFPRWLVGSLWRFFSFELTKDYPYRQPLMWFTLDSGRMIKGWVHGAV